VIITVTTKRNQQVGGVVSQQSLSNA